MSERKYLYFNNSDGILTHIDKAIKGEIYTGFGGIEFIVREGDVNIKHYAIKNKLNFLAIGGESPEHYNAKMKIVKELKYYDDIFEQDVHFAKVVPEQKINDKIPDLSCYDEKGNLVMLIEIKYSNGKDFEDIEKLSKNKVPLVEIDIKDENKCKHLILPTLLEINKPRVQKIQGLFKESAKKIKRKIEESEREYREFAEKHSPNINFFRDGIQELNDGIQSSFQHQISHLNEGIETEIESFKRAIQQLTESERELKNKISEPKEPIFKNDYRLGKLEKEITRIESEIKKREYHITKIAEKSKIEWFRNKWMNNTINNKLEEIRYWCS